MSESLAGFLHMGLEGPSATYLRLSPAMCQPLSGHGASFGALSLAGPAVSQVVKMGVQYSLWGGSVVNLGTEKHRKKYFDDIDRFRLPGEPR